MKAPQPAFHLWVATHGLGVRDSFSWSKERHGQEITSIFGIARVDVTDAEAIVALSGSGLFVDPRKAGFPEYVTEWVETSIRGVRLLSIGPRLGRNLSLLKRVLWSNQRPAA